MDQDQKDIYRIALSMVPKVGSRRARQLLHHFGSAEAVFHASPIDLKQISGISKGIVEEIKKKSVFARAEEELSFIKKNNIQLLYYLDDDYPTRLKPYDDSPVCLFYKGSVPLNGRKHVSIIGTRTPTEQGKWICEKLISDLKSYDITVISGLAYGVDITAHKTCIKAGIPTLGVVAHGLDTIYPSVHKGSAREMVQNGGIITEFVRGTKPDRDRFPARNRIIAGLSDALVVIESKESGGSMITANFANDYNKDVFAIPGRIDDISSQGCNKLIKEHKAFLLDSAEELVKMMRWEAKSEKEIQRSLFFDLTRDEQKMVECVKMGVDDIDGLCSAMSMPQSEISSLLLKLELDGVIRSIPGKRYIVLA